MVGQPFTLTGTNLCANATATFNATGPGGSIDLGSAQTNGSGSVSLAATAPSTPGTYTVVVSTTAGGCSLSASLVFTVTAPIVTMPGGLPATGNDPSSVGALAAFALLIGAALVVLARRRRLGAG